MSSSVYYRWKSFEEDEDRPEKPRRFGVTEMRSPQYNLLSQNLLQDLFESIGQFVDGLKFSGGSQSLMPKSSIKEVIDMAHEHDVYVSTGDWAEHFLRKGPSAFKEYVEECKKMGFDTIELNMGMLGIPEETLLRYVRLIKGGGLKAKPQFGAKFNKSDIPIGGNRAFGAYVPPVPRTSEFVEDVDLLIGRAERCLEAGADMIMIEADDVCKDADSVRADIIAKAIGRLGLEKTMFEASNARTAELFIKRYGPKVNLFVDHSHVIGLECLEATTWVKVIFLPLVPHILSAESSDSELFDLRGNDAFCIMSWNLLCYSYKLVMFISVMLCVRLKQKKGTVHEGNESFN